MSITRNDIVARLKAAFEPNPKVYAFWLEGSDSLGSVDKYSDLDIWFDVEDGHEQKIMKEVERVLKTLAPLDLVYHYNHSDPKIIQEHLHIKGTSEFLLLDICIQSHSRKAKFTKEMTHELPFPIFDKTKITKLYSLNQKAVNKEIAARVEHLRLEVAQSSRVKKYILRGQFLESWVYYNRWILGPLVELFRIKYAPLTRDMGLVHISNYLPKKELKQLESLYQVKSVKDIGTKSKKALQMCNSLLKVLCKN
ncbi:MAG: hypothetical protein KAZ30_03450 [Candidatus Magasanikbacteria bacterium]|nr:hypothetical protein [Candidatus Magasanikbacteria bacterium]